MRGRLLLLVTVVLAGGCEAGGEGEGSSAVCRYRDERHKQCAETRDELCAKEYCECTGSCFAVVPSCEKRVKCEGRRRACYGRWDGGSACVVYSSCLAEYRVQDYDACRSSFGAGCDSAAVCSSGFGAPPRSDPAGSGGAIATKTVVLVVSLCSFAVALVGAAVCAASLRKRRAAEAAPPVPSPDCESPVSVRREGCVRMAPRALFSKRERHPTVPETPRLYSYGLVDQRPCSLTPSDVGRGAISSLRGSFRRSRLGSKPPDLSLTSRPAPDDPGEDEDGEDAALASTAPAGLSMSLTEATSFANWRRAVQPRSRPVRTDRCVSCGSKLAKYDDVHVKLPCFCVLCDLCNAKLDVSFSLGSADDAAGRRLLQEPACVCSEPVSGTFLFNRIIPCASSVTSRSSASPASCPICYKQTPLVAFLPCLHVTSCIDCASRMKTVSSSTKPACCICRNVVTAMVDMSCFAP
ncbi:hypothetical protein DIPPA_10663 [Diplonema papillatum]|nr:hypothetical protein DIPPA_10663 [Diplonema papillatum]